MELKSVHRNPHASSRSGPEMRDNVQRIAREIQRGKTSKEERITANTVMRVAILLLTKHFKVRAVEDRTRRKSFFKKSKLRFLGPLEHAQVRVVAFFIAWQRPFRFLARQAEDTEEAA